MPENTRVAFNCGLDGQKLLALILLDFPDQLSLYEELEKKYGKDYADNASAWLETQNVRVPAHAREIGVFNLAHVQTLIADSLFGEKNPRLAEIRAHGKFYDPRTLTEIVKCHLNFLGLLETEAQNKRHLTEEQAVEIIAANSDNDTDAPRWLAHLLITSINGREPVIGTDGTIHHAILADILRRDLGIDLPDSVTPISFAALDALRKEDEFERSLNEHPTPPQPTPPSSDKVRLEWHFAVTPAIAKSLLEIAAGTLTVGVQKTLGVYTMQFLQRIGALSITLPAGSTRRSIATINPNKIARVGFKQKDGVQRSQNLIKTGFEEYADKDAWRVDLETIAADIPPIENDLPQPLPLIPPVIDKSPPKIDGQLAPNIETTSLLSPPIISPAIAEIKTERGISGMLIIEIKKRLPDVSEKDLAQVLKEIGNQSELARINWILGTLADIDAEIKSLQELRRATENSMTSPINAIIETICAVVKNLLELQQKLHTITL